MAVSPIGGAVKALQLELKKIQEEPVEGFRVNLINDENLFEWEVAIFGPPGTLYEGGYFKVIYHGYAQSLNKGIYLHRINPHISLSLRTLVKTVT